MQEITLDTIAAMAAGSAVFGGGGGGDPALGEMMALHAIDQHGPVPIVHPDGLDDGTTVVPIAFIGAPTVIQEKIPNGHEGRIVRERMEEMLDRPVGAFMSAELGGLNGVIPVAWCAEAGLPMVDADLMGRAYPRLQMVTPTIFGRDINPVVLVDERSNTVTFETISNEWAEKIVRSATVAMGGAATMGLYPMSAEETRRITIAGSITRSIEVGRSFLAAEDDPVASLVAETDALRLIDGKIIDVERRTRDGWAFGSVVVEGTGAYAGSVLRIEFQNENLVAILDGEVVASVPDIITVVDVHTAYPVVTEILRYGQRVSVVALPCDPIWRTADGLALAGPSTFGYDVDYTPVEENQ